MDPEIPHGDPRPPTASFNPTIKVIKYCPLCGSNKGYTDAGKVDGMQMYACRSCQGMYPKEVPE